MSVPYRGRFAPSPTGPLHAGSLVAALASWLDARAHQGAWLVRIEDLDPPREAAGAACAILETLGAFGLEADEPVIYQSQRGSAYAAALQHLTALGLLYGCSCTRRTIGELTLELGHRTAAGNVYPGTCRGRPIGEHTAIRIRTPAALLTIVDRRCGAVTQQLEREVGDFVLRRADGTWAYQLAVVVDDAASGITDIVRGADLLDNTPRQAYLQRALCLTAPRTLHVALVNARDGRKLSKQNGAAALDCSAPVSTLERAWQHLGFVAIGADSRAAFLRRAVDLWRERWVS
jgi:glutamyl-Q tRNA(Asp) synthetase